LLRKIINEPLSTRKREERKYAIALYGCNGKRVSSRNIDMKKNKGDESCVDNNDNKTSDMWDEENHEISPVRAYFNSRVIKDDDENNNELRGEADKEGEEEKDGKGNKEKSGEDASEEDCGIGDGREGGDGGEGAKGSGGMSVSRENMNRRKLKEWRWQEKREKRAVLEKGRCLGWMDLMWVESDEMRLFAYDPSAVFFFLFFFFYGFVS
jgi:hypothetical protein